MNATAEFGSLLNRADDAVLLISYPGGQIVDANLGAEQLYGYSRGELQALSVADIRSPESRGDISRQMDVAERHGLRFVTSHVDRNGRSISVVVQSRSLQIDGEPYLISIISRNPARSIARPHLAQVKSAAGYALVHNKQIGEIIASFAMISEFATAGMLLLDASGSILKANSSFCSLLGYSEEEILGEHAFFCTLPADMQVSADQFSALIAGRIRSYEVEKRAVTRSGEVFWVRVTATALISGRDSQMLCVCQIEDISAEKRHRDELRHYEAIVRYADVAIYSTDLNGAILSWNPAAERTFGYGEDEIRGQSVAALIKEGEALPYLEQLTAGQAVQVETTRRCKDGHAINVALNLSPIRNERGEIVGVSSLARDTTALKELQAEMTQLDRLNIVGEIAASIGHEVRNPMTTVRGYLQLMQRRQELQSLRPQMNLMIEELDRANDIISEFLSFARSKPPEMVTASLNNAISTLSPLIEAEAVMRGNEIVLNLGEIPLIRIDAKEIRQMLLNLVRNGLEAMKPGGKLTISTHFEEGKVVLAVADQGSGIPKEHLSRIGTAFFTTKAAGTGLGLPTCYSIADKHRAKISIQTGPGGSTFRVHFQLDNQN